MKVPDPGVSRLRIICAQADAGRLAGDSSRHAESYHSRWNINSDAGFRPHESICTNGDAWKHQRTSSHDGALTDFTAPLILTRWGWIVGERYVRHQPSKLPYRAQLGHEDAGVQPHEVFKNAVALDITGRADPHTQTDARSFTDGHAMARF
jgi:hypothetical protein